MVQEGNKIEQVCILEGTVSEAQEVFEVGVLMTADEIERGIVHALQQLRRLLDDGLAIAPGKDGGEEACNLDVCAKGEAMWDADGVFFEEFRLVVALDSFIQEGLEGG